MVDDVPNPPNPLIDNVNAALVPDFKSDATVTVSIESIKAVVPHTLQTRFFTWIIHQIRPILLLQDRKSPSIVLRIPLKIYLSYVS